MSKKVAIRVHTLILQKKWNLDSSSAGLLGGISSGLQKTQGEDYKGLFDSSTRIFVG